MEIIKIKSELDPHMIPDLANIVCEYLDPPVYIRALRYFYEPEYIWDFDLKEILTHRTFWSKWAAGCREYINDVIRWGADYKLDFTNPYYRERLNQLLEERTNKIII